MKRISCSTCNATKLYTIEQLHNCTAPQTQVQRQSQRGLGPHKERLVALLSASVKPKRALSILIDEKVPESELPFLEKVQDLAKR